MPTSILITALFAILVLLTLPGSMELLLVTSGLLIPPRRRRAARGVLGHIKIVVPAHNEELTIARCVRSLQAQSSRTSFQIVVVADNCTDRTAREAILAGARVLVRNAPEQRGKGFALRFAFDALQGEALQSDALQGEAFDAVAVVDADSVVSANFLDELAAHLADGADAVQCRFLVLDAEQSSRSRLLNVALLAFNVVRPLGRSRWGWSAGLLGNGFAISRSVLDRVPYLADSVVEDLEYHWMLVGAGFRVRFADCATVWGEAPAARTAVRSQRSRWEGGRLRMLREHGLGIVAQIARGRGSLTEPFLDLACLPLAFHVALLGGIFLIPGGMARGYAAAGTAIVACHVAAAAALGGNFWGSLRTLATAPVYVAWKFSTLPALLRNSRRSAPWVRTGRGTSLRNDLSLKEDL